MNAVRNTLRHLGKAFLLMAFSLALVVACHQPVIQTTSHSTENLDISKECKTVQHALGETCIPIHPQRIVILDEYYLLDNISALGIKPVGFARCVLCISSERLSKFAADVSSVGGIGEPSLEKILSLKPDLVLGLDGQASFYPLLSDIAPTVLIENPEINGFKPALKYLAEILDENDRAEEILAKYNQRIQNFRQQLEEKLKGKTVSLIYPRSSGKFAIDIPELTIYGQVMGDAGIQFSPAYEYLKNNHSNLQSIEVLPDWDADFLFVLQTYKRHEEEFRFISEQPIWSTLKAVQNNRVHAINLDVWGPITATQFVDDLCRYFSEML